MKLTSRQLRQIIKEEVSAAMDAGRSYEADFGAEVRRFNASMNRFMYPSGDEVFRPQQAGTAVVLVAKLSQRIQELEEQLKSSVTVQSPEKE